MHMGRVAKTVFTQQQDIDRIERLVSELVTDTRVLVTLDDGRVVEGMVLERPALQLFLNPEGAEGFNAILRFYPSSTGAGNAEVWLSDVRLVERMG